MRFVAIIPARYASTRFPAKPLANLCGKPVIQRVYEQVREVLDDVFVATDDERIFKAVESFGGRAIMTRADHKSGTDRCFEAYNKTNVKADVVINIQGDEPFIQASQIRALQSCFDDETTQIATLVKPFTVSDDNRALYFSRSVIPFLRGIPKEEWLARHTFYKHIGLYAYRVDTLAFITQLPQSTLEKVESLEQLRWLDNGCVIRVRQTDVETIGIDTPEDLARAEAFLRNKKE